MLRKIQFVNRYSDGKKQPKLQSEINIDDLVDFIDEPEEPVSSILQDATSIGATAQTGVQTKSLQDAINNYARAMDQSAIAKSTGQPVRTLSQQYKGFIAEEYFKNTLKINALAKGVPDWKIGVYTNGTLPDGSKLSGIDEHVDISVWMRKHPWDRPMRAVDYQSKIFNDASKYEKIFNDSKYQNVEHVGGAGQGVNDTISASIGGKTIESDSITPSEAVAAADHAKAQNTPKYSKSKEKFDELHRVNMERAIASGAFTGFTVTTIQEIISVIQNSEELSEEQFITSIEHILCGTIEGGVRSGAITGSVQLIGKMLGKEIAANSLEAIPGMVIANVAIDFAKDLYDCFVTKTINTDDLLCNSINNIFSSVAGFGGAVVIGRIGERIADQISSQSFLQSASVFNSAKSAASTGAAIGSSVGPIGTVIGSVLGVIVINIGARTIINIANEDAQNAYCECIREINSHVELEGCARLYYFADSMESLSDFRLSFKNLLPCYNLISDLREYNIHKKALAAIVSQMDSSFESVNEEKNRALKLLAEHHQEQLQELKLAFESQRLAMVEDYKESVNTYVATSYMQYLELYEVFQGDAKTLVNELKERKAEHSVIIENMRHRNEINVQINSILEELISNGTQEDMRPFIEKLTWFMNQDILLIGRQYISFEEALYLVNGENFI